MFKKFYSNDKWMKDNFSATEHKLKFIQVYQLQPHLFCYKQQVVANARES